MCTIKRGRLLSWPKKEKAQEQSQAQVGDHATLDRRAKKVRARRRTDEKSARATPSRSFRLEGGLRARLRKEKNGGGRGGGRRQGDHRDNEGKGAVPPGGGRSREVGVVKEKKNCEVIEPEFAKGLFGARKLASRRYRERNKKKKYGGGICLGQRSS